MQKNSHIQTERKRVELPRRHLRHREPLCLFCLLFSLNLFTAVDLIYWFPIQNTKRERERERERENHTHRDTQAQIHAQERTRARERETERGGG